MARSRAALHVADDSDDLAQIERWYRAKLAEPAVIPGGFMWTPPADPANPDIEPEPVDLTPVRLGPTWQTGPDGHWLLPDLTLGWGVLAWCGRWLQQKRDVPWQFTLEQARFLLWWYALEPTGEFVYRDGVLQRLKGWGKDPVGACMCLAELIGPVRFGGWASDGQPIGIDVPNAWVQTAAVSLEQTKNTMRLIPGLVTDEAKARFDLQIGKEQVYALSSGRLFQAVTSSPTTLEGARATFVLPNETQHWDSSNSGHEMAEVIERNATKSADGAARTLRITNAYEPGMDSQAERDRDAWESVQAGRAVDTGLLYDSLEAAPQAPLDIDVAPMVLEGVRGDSVWLNIRRQVQSIADKRNPPSRSRRFWYNQITATEDQWMIPAAWDAQAVPGALEPGSDILMFLDGSKSDDDTALVAVRASDGRVFQLGVWTKPPAWDDAVRQWTVDRDSVDARVEWAFAAFKVLAFWGDPSDVRDDEGNRYWEALFDDWHRRYKDRLQLWAVRGGDREHAIAWDMRSPAHQAEFVAAAERFVEDVADKVLTHDGSLALRQHVRNARRRVSKYGVSLGKEHRESPRKVDLAVCAVGARMLWRLWLNKQPKQRSGKVW